MNVCPARHPRVEITPGSLGFPVPVPLYLHHPPRPDLDGFNASKRVGYYAAYQWGDGETKVGHEGVDLGVRLGDPVYATTALPSGIVRDVDVVDNYPANPGDAAGIWVGVLSHCPECGGWFNTRTLHLLAGSVTVTRGQTVARGQRIASGARSGSASWTHTHYEVRHSTDPNADQSTVYGGNWGTPYDPLAWGILTAAPQPVSWPPMLRIGSNHPRVATARALLYVAARLDGIPAVGASLFDSTVDEAVRRFQAEESLVVDGIIGPQTRNRLYAVTAETAD